MDASSGSHGTSQGTLVCDTDALIQIFLSDQGELLKKLKRIYGIVPVITEAVERELFRPRFKNGDIFQPKAKKALDNGALILLDEHSLGTFTSNDPHTTYISIQVEGKKNNRHLGLGEAYSHAAGVVLRAPVLSNDMRAIVIADRVGLSTAKPTIRAYDLFVLFHQIGELSDSYCDDIRKSLAQFGEVPPPAFLGRKFVDGLPKFFPRARDAERPILATGPEAELADRHYLALRMTRPRTAAPAATLADVWTEPVQEKPTDQANGVHNSSSAPEKGFSSEGT
jgi:hypothetical protein